MGTVLFSPQNYGDTILNPEFPACKIGKVYKFMTLIIFYFGLNREKLVIFIKNVDLGIDEFPFGFFDVRIFCIVTAGEPDPVLFKPESGRIFFLARQFVMIPCRMNLYFSPRP
jgi:hypothetical protein